MKKLIIFLLISMVSLTSIAQKVYNIKKMGVPPMTVKVEGQFIVSDSTIHIITDYKGHKTDATLKIINKSEINGIGSYNCLGMIGTSDKHIFSYIPTMNKILWKGVNSIDNSYIEQFFILE